MTQSLGNACSDDCGSLREGGLAYVALTSPLKTLQPLISPKSPKDGIRGFNHVTLGCLLCPIKYIKEFDADPPAYVFIVLNLHHSNLSCQVFGETQRWAEGGHCRRFALVFVRKRHLRSTCLGQGIMPRRATRLRKLSSFSVLVN
jgi:hypothetical protein